MNYEDSISFELGFDIYRYDYNIPEHAGEALWDGWRAAKQQFGNSRLKSDKYIKKWLQIRSNAIRRGKYVDHGVSADYLRKIDIDFCPVTGVRLTTGLREDSDWSIDRALNDHDYVCGNLLVMSVLANRAKGDKTFQEIALLATTDTLYPHVDSLHDELTQAQWCKLNKALIPAAEVASQDRALRFLTGEEYLPGQPYDAPARFQVVLTNLAFNYVTADLKEKEKSLDVFMSMFHILFKRVPGKIAKRKIRLMAAHMRTKFNQTNGWAYWANKKPSRLYVELWTALDDDTKAYVQDVFLERYTVGNGFSA